MRLFLFLFMALIMDMWSFGQTAIAHQENFDSNDRDWNMSTSEVMHYEIRDSVYVLKNTGNTGYYSSMSLFSDLENPLHLYPSTVTDSYLACLTASNSLGCADTTCKSVTIDPEFLVSIPNAFSPDGDHVNDFFVPVFNDIPLAEYNLIIVDRSGRIVFESGEQGERWDGSGALDENYFSADGVYHYKLVIREFNRPEKREFIGFVTVLR
jgi:gliding motility-associated-like protein